MEINIHKLAMHLEDKQQGYVILSGPHSDFSKHILVYLKVPNNHLMLHQAVADIEVNPQGIFVTGLPGATKEAIDRLLVYIGTFRPS